MEFLEILCEVPPLSLLLHFLNIYTDDRNNSNSWMNFFKNVKKCSSSSWYSYGFLHHIVVKCFYDLEEITACMFMLTEMDWLDTEVRHWKTFSVNDMQWFELVWRIRDIGGWEEGIGFFWANGSEDLQNIVKDKNAVLEVFVAIGSGHFYPHFLPRQLWLAKLPKIVLCNQQKTFLPVTSQSSHTRSFSLRMETVHASRTLKLSVVWKPQRRPLSDQQLSWKSGNL
jgi:hypothetical protein